MIGKERLDYGSVRVLKRRGWLAVGGGERDIVIVLGV